MSNVTMPTISKRLVIILLTIVLIIIFCVIKSDNNDKYNTKTESAAAHGTAHVHGAAGAGAAPIAASDPIRYSAGDAPSLTIQPHIVFILADDMGWNDVGYHGSEIKTPFMDRLAMTGLRLENYYVQHVCSPSRASLMSGLYQSHTGIDRIIQPYERGCLPLHLPIIPESLRHNGYSTHLVGKWHLGMSRKGCLPRARGFDTFFGFYGGSEGYYTHSKRKKARYANFTVDGYDFRDNDRVALEYQDQYATHLYATRAENIIAKHGQNKKPMFLFISMQAPHSPMQVPEKYLNPYHNIQDKTRKTFAGMMTCMDEAIKNVTFALKKHGLRHNTVIIFSSDNGAAVSFGANNGPLRGSKGSFYEGGIRVVGFVNSPLLSPLAKGAVFRGLMGAADWYPTLVEGLAGGKMGEIQTDGYNMWNALRLGTASPRTEYLYNVGGDCEWNPKLPFMVNDSSNIPLMYGTLRVGPWKLQIRIPDQELEEVGVSPETEVSVFNIVKDPYEENNILETHQDVFKTVLVDRLKYHCRTHVQYFPLVEDENSDPRKRNGVFGPWL